MPARTPRNLTLWKKDCSNQCDDFQQVERPFEFNRILDTITDGIYAIDKNGICKYSNAASWQMLGFDDAKEIIGKDIHGLIHYRHGNGRSYPADECRIKKVIEDGKAIIADDEVFWSKTGDPIAVRYHAYPHYFDGELIGTVIAFSTITDKILPERLIQANSIISNVFKNVGAGIIYSDENGRILSANQAVLELVQYSIDELRSIDFASLIADENLKREKVFRRQLLDGQRDSYKMEQRYIRKDKKIVEVFIHAGSFVPIPNALPHLITVLTDISECKASERQLQASDKSKNRFISIISHDLRNPIGSIKTLTDLMKMELQAGNDAAIREYVELIAYQADQTNLLLNNLLDWSKMHIETGEFQFERLLLSGVIAEVVNGLQITVLNKSLKVQICCPEGLYIYSEKNMLSTVIRNLISNAIKFSYEGGIIQIIVAEYDSDTILAVEDGGKGMSAIMQETIFNGGLPVTTPGTKNENGTGLGLLLTKEIVQLLGGKIWVDSTEGKGSKFYVALKKTEVTIPY